MPRITLASALNRWLHADGQASNSEVELRVEGNSVDLALDSLFELHPVLRSYVLDEHGSIRRHVAIFVDGTAIRHQGTLQLPLAAHSEIYIMQALSGG